MGYPLAVYAVAALVAFTVYKVISFLWQANTSPLRHLPGPPTESLFWGNMLAIQKEENSVPQERWVEQYGHSIAYKGLFGVRLGFMLLVSVWTNGSSAALAAVDCGH